MPMIELTLPKNALSKEKTAELVDRLTQTLLRWEGAPPNSKAAQEISWGYVNWVDEVNVGGKPAAQPRYRVITTVPQGALRDDEARNGLVADVTRAVIEAEGSQDDPTAASRIWCIINEVTDGNWGGNGRIFRLKDIAALVHGDRAVGETIAQKRLANS